jgi:predicted acyltransferase
MLGFRLGSLTYGLVICAVWFLVAFVMWRRRIFVKV